MREFFYSFLLTYPLRKEESSENRWYRAFFVKTSCKNVVFSYLNMSRQIGPLFECPNFESYLLFKLLSGDEISQIISLVLHGKSVMLVAAEDTFAGDLVATLFALLNPA